MPRNDQAIPDPGKMPDLTTIWGSSNMQTEADFVDSHAEKNSKEFFMIDNSSVFYFPEGRRTGLSTTTTKN